MVFLGMVCMLSLLLFFCVLKLNKYAQNRWVQGNYGLKIILITVKTKIITDLTLLLFLEF